MKKRSFLFLIFIVVVLLLIGCSLDETSTSDTEKTKTNDTENHGDSTKKAEDKSEKKENEEVSEELRVAVNAQPPTIDSHVTTADATRDVARQIFETLVTLNSNFQPQPMLAESYETSEDGQTMTFHLRKGVTFHNGDEMKAEDVVASMNRWLGLSSKAKAALSGASFEEKDEYTVLLNLEKPSGVALSVMASPTQFPAIMPKEVIESASAEGVNDYIGTGPYQFEEWKQDQYIKLAKFDDYQALSTESDGAAGKKEALVESLYFMMVPDATTRIVGLQSGAYDIALGVPFDNYEQLDADPNVEALSILNGFSVFVFNKKQGLFTDEKMRQAVLAALDLEAVLKASHGDGFYRLDHGLMQIEQTDWYHDAGKELYNQNDPEKGKKLLEEAGYDGTPLRFITTREYEEHYNAAVVIQEQLEQIGISVELEVYDWATIANKQPDPTAYDAFITSFSTSVDPTQFLFLDSKNEWAGWTNNPKIDDLLDQIRSSQSQENSKELFGELQQEFWESVPIIKIGDTYELQALSKNVEGYEYLDGPLLWNIKKSE